MKKSLISLVLLGVLVLFSGCSALSIGKSSNNGAYVSSSNYHKTYYENRQTGVKYYDVTQGKEKVTPKKTLMERVGAWIAGMSLLGLILLIAGMILLPSGTVAAILGGLYFKFKNAFTETVTAIKRANVVSENNKLKEELKYQQSLQTKQLVTEIKDNI